MTIEVCDCESDQAVSLTTNSVPVYDARKIVVDFDTDLACLDTVVPPFVGEIPFGSFVVVGYTCSVYHTAVSGSSERVAHLGCNILWAIVCGTPKSRT